jgi:hypothetical protein
MLLALAGANTTACSADSVGARAGYATRVQEGVSHGLTLFEAGSARRQANQAMVLQYNYVI